MCLTLRKFSISALGSFPRVSLLPEPKKKFSTPSVTPGLPSNFFFPFCRLSQAAKCFIPLEMPPNARHSAAQQRENTKQGIISVEEAGELRADPTYVDSEAEDRLHSHNALFDCSFHPNDPSV